MTVDPTYIKTMFNAVGQYVLYPIFAGIFVAIYSAILNFIKNRRIHSLEFSSSMAIAIQGVLAELRIELAADRVSLALFHNGDHYIDGSPILKFSRMSEACGPGVSHEFDRFKGVLSSSFPELMMILKSPEIEHVFVKSLPDSMIKRAYITQGINSFILCNLYKSKELIGFISVDFIPNIDKISNFDALNTSTNKLIDILTNK